MADSVKVDVQGLRDFQRALRSISGELPRRLRVANKAAAEPIAADARARAMGRGGVAAKTAPSIRAGGEQRNAFVRIGGARYPFSLGAEFGSIRYRQFPAWTGSGSGAGYFLYPAIRDRRDSGELVENYGRLIDELARDVFPH